MSNQFTITQEDLAVILKGLSALPLGEAMGTFQRMVAQVPKPIMTPNGGPKQATTAEQKLST